MKFYRPAIPDVFGLVLLGWLLMGSLPSASAQPADTLALGEPIATFEDARALAADPLGRLIVADAGPSTILHVDPLTGRVLQSLGGPSHFATPSDVVVSGGLRWYIADEGNGIISWFGRDQRALGSVGERAADEPLSAPSRIAVAPNRDLYAIDPIDQVLLRWEYGASHPSVHGTMDDGRGELQDPVGLVLVNRSVYVADRARNAVLEFDRWGAFSRVVVPQMREDIRGLVRLGDRLGVISEAKVALYDVHGALLREVFLPASTQVSDIHLTEHTAYVLTATRLYAAPASAFQTNGQTTDGEPR